MTGTLERLDGEGGIEVTWFGDEWLFWREFNLALFHDLTFVAISFVALLTFMVIALRMPVFACWSLLIVAFSFPVGFAGYAGLLQQEKLPILAIVSIYLILGIGADAIFVFTNTFALEEADDRRRAATNSATPTPSPESSLPTTPADSFCVTPPLPSSASLGPCYMVPPTNSSQPSQPNGSSPSDMLGTSHSVAAHYPPHEQQRKRQVQVLARTLRHSMSGACEPLKPGECAHTPPCLAHRHLVLHSDGPQHDHHCGGIWCKHQLSNIDHPTVLGFPDSLCGR